MFVKFVGLTQSVYRYRSAISIYVASSSPVAIRSFPAYTLHFPTLPCSCFLHLFPSIDILCHVESCAFTLIDYSLYLCLVWTLFAWSLLALSSSNVRCGVWLVVFSFPPRFVLFLDAYHMCTFERYFRFVVVVVVISGGDIIIHYHLVAYNTVCFDQYVVRLPRRVFPPLLPMQFHEVIRSLLFPCNDHCPTNVLTAYSCFLQSPCCH